MTALTADMEQHETTADARQEAASLLAWLLPITKNFCAEAAFSCASEAIQVLGGAGYTLEWPAEQYFRDARVLSIYEGTSGMQALDLTLRRTLGQGGRPLDIFLTRAKRDLTLAIDPWAAGQFRMLLSMLQEAVGMLSRQNAEIVCVPFLQLASLATTGWVALRLTSLQESNGDHLRALGRHWLRMAVSLAQAELAQIGMKEDLTVEFDKIDLEKIV